MRIRKVAGGILSPTLTFLQKQQIEIGKRNGLTFLQLVKIYKPWLNYRQMEEIRVGLENGLLASQIRQYAACTNTSEQMRAYRIALESDEKIQTKTHILAAVTVLLSGLTAGAFIFYVFFLKPFTGSARDNTLMLELTEASIQLECGDVFEPSQYVKDRSDDSAQLILPDAIDTSVPGSYTAVYQLIADKQECIETLRVRVSDKTVPELGLSADQIEYSDFDKPFDCRSYIAYAKDSVDGNLIKKVSCSSQLHETGLQEVVYRVSDSSGNTAMATLMVNVIDKTQQSTDAAVQHIEKEPAEAVQNETISEEAYIQEETVIEGEWIYEDVNINETEVTHDIQ